MSGSDPGSLRPWLLSAASLAAAGTLLAVLVGLLPPPWPEVVPALLLLGLVVTLGLMAGGSWVGTPLGLLTRLERLLLAWTARFAPDPGAFLFHRAAVAPSLDRARQALEMAAARGHVPAQRELGLDLLAGAMGGGGGRAAALPWLRKAAARGDGPAAFALAESLRWGLAGPGREAEALEHYQRAARAGHRPAALWLAHAFAGGDGVAADPGQAATWAARAATLAGPDRAEPGLVQRMAERPTALEAAADGLRRQAGELLEDHLWEQRWFRGFTWTVTVVFVGLVGGLVLATPLLRRLMILLALWLGAASVVLRLYGLKPRFTSRDTRRLEVRAEAGEPDACYEYGRRFDQGHPDLPRDPAIARHWYDRAVRAGHPEALLALADLLAWGQGGPADLVGARTLLERALARGLPEAHVRLARLGSGLTTDARPADETPGEAVP